MRLKLFLLSLLAAVLPVMAQTATLTGVVVNSQSDSPVSGAYVTIQATGTSSMTGFNGDFRLEAAPGKCYIVITCDGFASQGIDVDLNPGANDIGHIRVTPETAATDFYGDANDLIFDEDLLEDEDENTQGIAALTGANDDIYYNTASYNFGPMYFRYRGYDSQYQAVYINGMQMNDLIRGRFTFSSLLGMTSRAFRNKTTSIGMAAANYGFGDIGGSVNYNTTTDLYAPGFNGSIAFTNSNYLMRAMVTYATGLNKKGWAFTVSAIGRYAKEGVIDGTFYNSGGLFLSIEKYFNANNQLILTAWGGPTQRATSTGTYQEVYDLLDNNLYNPNWGWYQGKKRAARVTETYDPTAMLNWLYKKGSTTVNTGLAVVYNYYNRSALQYYKANDPNPTYYRYLPSYYLDDNDEPTEQSEYYTWLWQNDQSFSQINWDNLYSVNQLNNAANANLPEGQQQGASYILENRINTTLNLKFNSYINTRINDKISLQGGVAVQYANSSNYKTIRDLLGGEFWIDVDPFSDRDITLAPDNLVNNFNYPDPYSHRVYKGDKFGYHYNLYALTANAWLQNTITLPHWDINYGFNVSYTQYQREGHMRNGRAPLTSYGKGKWQSFDNAGFKAGATYKLDGHNYFLGHVEYGTRAPLADAIYLMPRVKNDVVEGVSSERILSGDIAYTWNYRRFRGSLAAFATMSDNGIERTGFYDDRYNSYTYYILSGVKKVYKGVELGMAYKITPSVTATFAGTYARFQYKNNPQGTRTFENGLHPDTTQTVYLRNYYVGSTPQYAANIGIDWAAPGMWFFNINGTFQGDAYVNLSPAYHEVIADLWKSYPDKDDLAAKIAELSTQDKLKNNFTLNVSIGKVIYINRKVTLNLNLSVNNILNNRDVVTYAYQQGRLDTKNYDRNAYPNRYTYAQGVRAFLNIGVRF
ncbi:MAG: TonB-dependent receptor [Odoribacter sp.]|nr:TonB-dependent receptor [Odoribacter sp.]